MGTEPSSLRSSIRRKIPTDEDWNAVPTSPTEFIEVEITTIPDGLDAAEAAVTDAGGAVSASFWDTIIADVPAGKVTSIAENDAVRLIGDVIEPKEHEVPPENISEGVQITGADELHDLGVTGDDTTIAILDSEFDTSNEKYADQVVGTIGPSGYFSSPGGHGNLVTEIVADMAPDANLVLGTVFGQSILTTLDELENDFPEVDVATMSIGYYPTRIDGRDGLSQRIAQFTDADRIFTTSAGNESGVKYAWQWDDTDNEADPLPQLNGGTWNGPFTDSDGNSLMEFDSRLPEPERLPVGTPLSTSELDDMADSDVVGWLAVHWDEDWSSDDERYEVRLYDEQDASVPVASSLTETPFEEVFPEAQHFSDGSDHVYLEIQSVGASNDHHFDIWTWQDLWIDYYFDPTSEDPLYANDRCVGMPATSRDEDTLSIAAVQAVDLETTGIAFEKNKGDLKSYSSQGPTQFGRRGIDLAGPAHVSTLARGPIESVFGFNGTSAAAPHVGGGFALMNELTFSLDDIKTALFDSGSSIPDPDVEGPPNTKIGEGYLDVWGGFEQLNQGPIGWDVSGEDSVDVPDRTAIIDDPDVGEFKFTVSAIGRLEAGDTLTVNVTAPDLEYDLEVWDNELNTVDFRTLTGNATASFDTTGWDPGTYAVAPMEDGDPQAVYPLVIEAYEVAVSGPSTITTEDTLTVQADLSTVDGTESINEVVLGVMSEDSSTGASATMTEVDTTNDVYEGSISGLDADEYDMGVVVQGGEEINLNVEGMTVEENSLETEGTDLDSPDTDITNVITDNAKEAIGFSDVADLTVEISDGQELAQKWSVSRPDRPQFSTAEVDTEVAYLAGLDDSLEARWRDSGDQKWSFNRDGELSDSSPVLSHGMILIGAGGGKFYGLDATDGTAEFSVDAGTGTGSAVTSSAAVMNDVAYYADNKGYVHAVDLTSANGSTTPVWSVDAGGSIYGDVAAASGWVFVTPNGGDVVALDATDDGSEDWRISDGAAFGASSPTYHDGSVYVAGDEVHKIDPAAESITWSQSYGGTAGSSPTVYDGVVYVGSADGTMYALNDSNNGSVLWSQSTGGAIGTTPAVVGDRVIAGSMDGSLYVMNRTTGEVVGSKALGDPIRSSPVVMNGEIYVGTEGGTFFVLESIP